MVFALVLSAIPTFLNVTNASAQATCDTDFYDSNDILFFNHCEVNVCSGPPTALANTVASLRGNNNGEKIYYFWLDAGLAAVQAAGVTGSMAHEGGYSPFRQEMSQTWPAGGWGIAQFTFDPGQRGEATKYVRAAIGDELFNQYYQDQYGGSVFPEDGYVPKGVPVEVNDKFLLAELNYLLDHIKQLIPNNVRWEAYSRDWNVADDSSISLYDYLLKVTAPADAAKAWTYLYEYPGDIKNTSASRGTTADDIYKLYEGASAEAGASCGGGVTDGGMNLEQAKAFMEKYKQIDNGDPNGDKQYLSGACHILTDNCVTFSSYFIKKYTNLTFVSNDGGKVVTSTVAGNPGVETGTVPKAYSMFGTRQGSTICDDGLPCGHTGIVLGVDTANDKVIVGEAAWCNAGFTAAREYSLSEWQDGTHTYMYTANYLKDERKSELN